MTAPNWTEDAVRDLVVRQFTELLPGTVTAGPSENFFRLGGDSLGMVRMIEALHSHGLPLTARDFIARPTLDGIVANVMERLSLSQAGGAA